MIMNPENVLDLTYHLYGMLGLGILLCGTIVCIILLDLHEKMFQHHAIMIGMALIGVLLVFTFGMSLPIAAFLIVGFAGVLDIWYALYADWIERIKPQEERKDEDD